MIDDFHLNVLSYYTYAYIHDVPTERCMET